jgi:hypothetical protein
VIVELLCLGLGIRDWKPFASVQIFNDKVSVQWLNLKLALWQTLSRRIPQKIG